MIKKTALIHNGTFLCVTTNEAGSLDIKVELNVLGIFTINLFLL